MSSVAFVSACVTSAQTPCSGELTAVSLSGPHWAWSSVEDQTFFCHENVKMVANKNHGGAQSFRSRKENIFDRRDVVESFRFHPTLILLFLKQIEFYCKF